MTEEKMQKLATKIVDELMIPEVQAMVEDARKAGRAEANEQIRLALFNLDEGDPVKANIARAREILLVVIGTEPSQGDGKLDGAELIRRERERQKTVEGWTPEHDDQHAHGELASAAVCYAMIPDPESAAGVEVPADWPESWSELWWKPSPKDRVRELSKAGALIAAEIDRLMRAAEVKRRLDEASRG